MTKLPQKIWQTYKSKNLPAPARACQQTWLDKNPDYAYFLWDDDDIENYIKGSGDTDTYAFFKALPIGVMKADLWRYLILATEGGIYSDIDSVCCLPIRKWAPNIFTKEENVLLLGIERGSDKDFHFCQWTIAATPNHPALRYVCSYLVKKWKTHGIDLKYPHFVHATTGPGVWTEALLSYLDERGFASEIYDRYLTDIAFQEKCHGLGVFLFSRNFYSGEVSRNLFGSQNFGDGYVRWTEIREKIGGEEEN